MLAGVSSIIARVDDIENANEWAKGSFTIREMLNVEFKTPLRVLHAGTASLYWVDQVLEQPALTLTKLYQLEPVPYS
jgi:hypothetical protein